MVGFLIQNEFLIIEIVQNGAHLKVIKAAISGTYSPSKTVWYPEVCHP